LRPFPLLFVEPLLQRITRALEINRNALVIWVFSFDCDDEPHQRFDLITLDAIAVDRS
jgi:hypothetical protein